MDENFRVANAVIAALLKHGDEDIRAGLGYLLQEPLDQRGVNLKREIQRAALGGGHAS